ncbi:Auxin-responsive protein IAA9 [Senna tora]|uniref:Auxin-induced protein n=1 Tax=Senna tora TaxID=362788 RepID=A0A834WC44_9FABA|nr:Auxin-responsive protein IAA9 [Senna tora]
MFPPPLVEEKEKEGEGESNVSLLCSSTITMELEMESVCLKNYIGMGLSDSSSVDSSLLSSFSDERKKSKLNLKATELRLGLPGSSSPERQDHSDHHHLFLTSSTTQFDEKPLFPLCPSKNPILGNKRGFSDAMTGFSEGKFLVNSEVNTMLSSPNLAATKVELERPNYGVVNESRSNVSGCVNNNNYNSSSAAKKTQVVGWPPIRSFRKNSLSCTTKNNDEVDGKAMFVKVSLDGAPYLRKVDLNNYCSYPQLSSSLEKMFTCFTIGHHGSVGKDVIHGSEYVLTYEDKDSDWMLVGDVPWEMFIETCRRMRIMKSSDAIGLAPRAVEKCKSRKCIEFHTKLV